MGLAFELLFLWRSAFAFTVMPHKHPVFSRTVNNRNYSNRDEARI